MLTGCLNTVSRHLSVKIVTDGWVLYKLCEGLLTSLPEKLPNMHRPQNLVNSLMPASSKLSRSIRPKEAQNNVCVVSHKLKLEKVNMIFLFIVTW